MSYTELYTAKAASFLGFENVQKPEYVVLGVPYDGTSTYRPGSRFAPDAIREASMNIETYSLRARLDAETIKVEDLGNLHV
ncbi:agmatinase, partial [Candidatus Bathyarchaeota archaeon]